MLHYVTLCYITLRYITLHYITLHCTQAQHDSEAAQLVQAVRVAACLPLLALSPARRSPQHLTLLSHLNSCLQVFLLQPVQA